jgi:hypothetical protein
LLTDLQVKIFIFENYLEEKSAIVFKAHHSKMDGMGTVHALLSCQDEFIQDQKPPLKSYSWLDYIDRGFPSLIALKWVGPKLLSIPSGTRNENPLR